MGVDYRRGISILELIIYLPSLFVAIFLAFRHGFRRASGWVFIVLFCLVRIVGAGFSLATLSSSAGRSVYIGTAICASIGLSPLLLACEGYLTRINHSIERKSGRGLPFLFLRLVELMTIAALVLLIIGYTSSSDSSPVSAANSNTKTKIGIGLYIGAYVLILLLFLNISSLSRFVEKGERRLIGLVAFCLPLIAVRLVWSCISVFSSDTRFRVLVGDVTINLVMVVIEEILVVLVSLAVGFTLKKRPDLIEVEGNRVMTHRSHENRHQHEHGHGYPPQQRAPGRRIRRVGLLGHAVGYAMDEYAKRSERRGR